MNCVGLRTNTAKQVRIGIAFPNKKEAEREAWEYTNKKGHGVVTVCPALTIWPMLQSTINASSSILKDGAETVVNKDQRIVEVRDVARAILLAYEKLEVEGRYICSAYLAKT